MDFIKNFVNNWICDELISGIMPLLKNIFASIKMQELQDGMIQPPSAYQGGAVWDTAVNIAEHTMVPIAALVLTAVMCIELIGWVNEQNNMHSSGDVIGKLFRYIIRLFIGVLLVQRSPEITQGIFQLGSYAASQIPGAGGDIGFASEGLLAEMEISLRTKGMGELFSFYATAVIANAGMFIIRGVIWVTIMGRIFRIGAYVCMGAVPYATLMYKEHDISRIGVNYIKNLFALAFQGFFMFVMVVMYQAALSGFALSGDPQNMIFSMLLYSVVLAFALFNASALAKSIFDAH